MKWKDWAEMADRTPRCGEGSRTPSGKIPLSFLFLFLILFFFLFGCYFLFFPLPIDRYLDACFVFLPVFCSGLLVGIRID